MTYAPTAPAPPKIAIVTSIYGNYDDLKDNPIHHEDEVDWYCFTDNKNLKSDKWTIVNTPYHLNDPDKETYKQYYNYYDLATNKTVYHMMCAKYYKIKTHKIDVLQKYDYYIWVDGSIFLRPDFIHNIKKLIAATPTPDLINFKHSKRTNIKDELEESRPMKKYTTQRIQEQYDYYMSDGFPDTVGLYENTVCIKRNTETIHRIFDMWWIENLKWSFQDQLSYPYVLWKAGKTPTIIDENVFDNRDYTYAKFDLMQKH
jgi:hypothetical protein